MILFVFIWKRFFQLITFMYETKPEGHDGIAVYKSLHFSPDNIGNFPEVGETHVDGGCHWRVFRERINGSFMFLVRYFMIWPSRYALGYPFLISMHLMFMNSLCVALYVLAIL